VRARGYLTLDELLTVVRWKSPRALPRARGNSAADVEEITRCALSARSERFRIQALLGLGGVSWPTASVILHWFHDDPYPILDVRAIWSVGLEQPSVYSFEFWMVYVTACRELAAKHGVSMRVLDRALWQHSKEHGSPGSA
jgi:hypothetical protein